MVNDSRDRNTYLSEIDGLRSLAVLSVMLFHLDAPLLPGGFSGVDVFFVISGYVVSRAMFARGHMPAGQFAIDFFSRRFVRILPALLLCLSVTTVMAILFTPQSWLSATTAKVASWAYVGASNMALLWFQDDYFSPRAEYNLFTHTWSLGVEEQFYLVVPGLVLLWLLWRQRAGAKAVVAAGLMPLLATVSLVFAFVHGQQSPDGAYYLLPARFWELAAGVMLSQYQFAGRLTSARPRVAAVALAVGLAGVFAGFWWCDKAAFPVPWALLPVAGTLLCLYAVSASRENPGLGFAALRHPVATYVGRLSYSLYLWHWPVYGLFRWTVGLYSYWLVVAVAITFGLAALSYHWVETPVRRSRRVRSLPAWLKVLAGLVTMIALAFAASALFDKHRQWSLSATSDVKQWYPYGFRVPGVTEEPKPLEGKKLFVVGDSHTPAYSTLLREASDRLGVHVEKFPVRACNVGSLMAPVRQREECVAPIEQVLARIDSDLHAGDMVFFASLRSKRLIDQWAAFDYEDGEPRTMLTGLVEKAANRDDATTVLEFDDLNTHLHQPGVVRQRKDAWRETAGIVAELREKGIWVLFDAPKPVLQMPPFRCSDWFNRHNPVCALGADVDRGQLLVLREPMMDSLVRMQQRFDNVVLWDPFPVLCPDAACSAYDADGRPLFFDGDHLSAHGNRVLYPSFSELLLSVMGGDR